jgi:hypothetical protein
MVINKIKDFIKNSISAYYLLPIIFSVLYFFSGTLFGLDFTDGFFHINEATQVTGNLPFETILTSHILKLVYGIIGKNLFIYRLINSMLFFVSFMLMFRLIKNKKQLFFSTILLSCFFIIATPMNFNILGFDSFSILSITCTIWFALKYSLDSFKNIILFSLLIASCILIRLPNAIFLPISFFYFLYYKQQSNWTNKKLITNYSCLWIFSAVFYFTYLLLTYHNFKNAFSSFASNERHSIFHLIRHYYLDLPGLLYNSMVFGILFLIVFFQKRQFIIPTTIIFLGIFYYLFKNTYHIYHWSYSVMIFAFISVLLCVYFFRIKKINTKLIFIYLSTLTICIGSNTGFLKMGLLCPVAMLFCYEIGNEIGQRFIVYMLMAFSAYGIFEQRYYTFEDNHLTALQYKIETKGLSPIRTSKNHYDFINAVAKKTEELKTRGYKVVYYGKISHLFNFLNPAPRKMYTFDQGTKNTEEINEIISQHGTNKLALIITYESEMGYQKWFKNTPIEKEIVKQGFRLSSDSSLTIYLRD